MSKRILALLLCAVMLVPCLFGLTACSSLKYEGDVGAYITMYLTDDVYDFDPAKAYYNADAINIVSLMYDTLFTLNKDGKVKKSMAKEYEFYVDERTGEHCLEIELNQLTWTNGSRISAADVVYAWTRLLSPENDFAAASLLYDIKNARAVKEGDVTKDNLGVEAVSISTLRVTFENEVDEDRFLLNLTSVATAPLLESFVSRNADWAKKPSTMVTSGAYKMGKIFYKENTEIKGGLNDDNAIDENGNVSSKNFAVKEVNYFYLERNPYYYRNTSRDEIDDSVTNYRILVDCSKSDAEILQDYKDGKIFYMGNIPLSVRNDVLVRKEAVVSDALSTFVLSMNQYAAVKDGATGSYIFADANVRQALSLVIDRRAIARRVVFAEAANGLVAPGVFDGVKVKNGEFRDEGGALIATLPNKAEALRLLNEAGIDPAKYAFSIKVAAYDDVHVAIVEMVADAWNDLGFNVTVDKIYAIQNNDYSAEVEGTPADVCDDLIVEAIQRNKFEVIAYDYTAFSADAFSMLSSFASTFSGMSVDFADNGMSYDFAQLAVGNTGHVSVEYNVLMEAIYYIPYYASIRKAPADSYLQKVFTTRPYLDTARALAQNALKITNAAAAPLDGITTIVNFAERKAAIDSAIDKLSTAALDVERAFSVAGQTNTAADLLNEAMALIQQAKATINGNYQPESVNPTVPMLKTAAEKLLAAAEMAAAAAMNADSTTLYDLIGRIYSENGITPTTKTKEWAEQKATLLHKAEELFVKEMPVIPVVFNQNAVLVSEKLSKVDSTYYIPGYFRKTKLEDYETLVYTLNKVSKEDGSVISSETRSIFDEFPIAKWDDIGKTVDEVSLVK